MTNKISIIHNSDTPVPEELQTLMEYITTDYKLEIELLDHKTQVTPAASTLILLYLDDLQIKSFLKAHLNNSIRIAFIPHKDCPRAMSSYGVPKDIYEALDEAIKEDSSNLVDVLTCNGEIVFTNVIIGDVHGLNYKNFEEQTLFTKIKNFYLNLKNLGFKDYTLTTAKGQSVQTVATGIMVLEHNAKSGKYSAINEELSLHDGQLDAIIISPTSIFAYIYYLLVVIFYSKLNPSSLPKSLGVIKSSKLNITSTKPMDFMIDTLLVSAKEIEFEVFQDALTLCIGKEAVPDVHKNIKKEDIKEVIKTQHLPKGEVKTLLLSESVPLFKKANEDDFKELFLALKEGSKPSFVFIVLTVLSTLLATTGLFQNSASVIIGAMILAPLMSPIISLAMGVVRGESFFIASSLKTLALGVFMSLLFSSIYTYFMPLNVLTDEMRGRLNPNVLDLMVAIISGIAGAYANAKSEIAKSLAGVAIAVALVPPLSVVGIGLGWGDLSVSYGASLLFITNLIGITLSAAITFLVLGYAPIYRAKKGIVYTSIILAIVTIPLVISFNKAILQSNMIIKLHDYTYVENDKMIRVHLLHVNLSKEIPEIFLQTNSNDVLNKEDLQLLKSDIQKNLNQNVILNISTNTIVE